MATFLSLAWLAEKKKCDASIIEIAKAVILSNSHGENEIEGVLHPL